VALFIHIFCYWSETFVELNQDNTNSATILISYLKKP
jgi:hypothetical protein